MTEHTTMNTIIHAAFRRDLDRFDAALATFPDGSQPRADQLATAWDNFAGQLHHHHSDEETIFFPAFRSLGVDEALIADMDGEHATMLTALNAADAAMKTLHAQPSAENATAARSAIADLQTVLLAHLEHEERDLEPFAVRHRSTRQLKQAQSAVRRAHKGGIGTFMAWLADGADPDATTALRHEIPAPVLLLLTRAAGRRYNREIAPVWA